MNPDLNRLKIASADGPPEELVDPATVSEDGATRVFFRSILPELLRCIRQSDVVVGCVAWLTHPEILAALAERRSVAIVVQKEDFLRPDIGDESDWKARLRQRYNALTCEFDRYDGALKGTVLHFMSMAGDPGIEPVRCVGNHNSSKKPAFPRAHHKFLVFCRRVPDLSEDPAQGTKTFEPYAAWTGSFNLTVNATNSFENALLSKDPALVKAYFTEWAQIEALSEPLDWEVDWTAPEWRIGT